MIRPGTLCLLVGDHPHAGKCCTITGPLMTCKALDTAGVVIATAYPVDIPRADRPFAKSWGARPHQLVPLTPPGLHDDEPARTDKPREVSV